MVSYFQVRSSYTYGAASNFGVAGSLANITFPVGAKSFAYLTTLTAGVTTGTTDAYLAVTITDNSGYTTGAIAQGITTDLAQDKALLLTESTTTAGTFTTSFTVATSGSTVEKHFTISIDEDGTATTSDTTAVAAVTTSNGALTVSPSTALSLKIGSSITYAVTVKDDFGRVLPNASVKMVSTGRNANQTVTPPTAVTSSTGVATFTLTDAPLAGTTSLTDSIVFTATGYDGSSKAATAVTIAWSATGPGTLDVSTIHSLNPIYNPAPGQTGDVTLTLTATGYNQCGINAVASKTISIIPRPVVTSPAT